MVPKRAALFQSLATSCAALVTLVALAHEVVGAKLVPWAVELFGGSLGFYGAGAFGVILGLSLVAGTLRLIPFAVSGVSVVLALLGTCAGLYAALVHRDFHFFAWVLVLASLGAAIFHSKAIAAQHLSGLHLSRGRTGAVEAEGLPYEKGATSGSTSSGLT